MAKAKKRGVKACPKCGKEIGARSMTCKYCGAEIKTSSGGGKKDGFGVVRQVVEFVKQRGSIEKARAELDAMDALLKRTGGIAQAKAALDELEAIKGLK